LKIAISSQGEGTGSQVDPRFGRCPFLVLADTETGGAESIPNPSLSSEHGAGIATVQFLAEKGVEAVLAEKVGPNALSALSASGIRIYKTCGGTVAEAIEKYKRGALEDLTGSV